MAPISGIPKFVHRKNRDSTFDSFCSRCFVTVATAPLEAELELKERVHSCNPSDLIRLQNFREIELGR